MTTRPIPNLTPDIMRLAAVVLDRMADGDRGEFRLADVPGYETAPARRELFRALEAWNGSPEDFDPDGWYLFAEAWLLACFCGAIIDKAAGPPTEPDEAAMHDEAVLQAERALCIAKDSEEGAKREAEAAAARLREKMALRAEAEDTIAKLRAGR